MTSFYGFQKDSGGCVDFMYRVSQLDINNLIYKLVRRDQTTLGGLFARLAIATLAIGGVGHVLAVSHCKLTTCQ